MKKLARYDILILLLLSLLTLSLFSRAAALDKKETKSADYTLLVVFEGKAPATDTPLSLYGYPVGSPRFLGEERAYLSARGVRLESGFFIGGERWLGANLPLSLEAEGQIYHARILALFQASDDF